MIRTIQIILFSIFIILTINNTYAIWEVLKE